ncbi:MAG TPA: ribosome maturation factor RimM [Candidatus Aminicenantes bacterium]|nr:ribosome maturation factor RimM [Candidatus Aminicenantes bacterium]
MKKADLVALGRIVRSQGRDGTVKLKLREKGIPAPSGGQVYVDKGSGPEAFAVESFRIDRNAPFLKLKGIETLAQADALAGAEVFAAAADFGRPAPGSFFVFEVLGSRVVTRDGTAVGEVSGLLEPGGPVLLVVRRGAGDVYVPFAEGIVVEVVPEERRIVIDPPDGLLELNEI